MDIKATPAIAHTEVTPDLITDVTTEAHHIINTQVFIIIDVAPCRRSSSHRNSSTHSRDCRRSRPHISYKSSRPSLSKPSSSSNKHQHQTSKHEDRKYKRVTIDDPQSDYYSLDNVSSDSDDDLKLKKPSLSNVSQEWEGPPAEETITAVCIMDCPTITVHAGKWYKALIDSGATILHLRYSAYKHIEDCYKTPIQTTTAKLNTTDGSLMSALGMTALHLRIAEFKFTHNFIICDWLADMELICGIDIQNHSIFLMPGIRKRTVTFKRKENS